MAPRCATSRDRGQRPQEVPVIKKHTVNAVIAAIFFGLGFLTSALLSGEKVENAQLLGDRESRARDQKEIKDSHALVEHLFQENAALRKQIIRLGAKIEDAQKGVIQ